MVCNRNGDSCAWISFVGDVGVTRRGCENEVSDMSTLVSEMYELLIVVSGVGGNSVTSLSQARSLRID